MADVSTRFARSIYGGCVHVICAKTWLTPEDTEKKEDFMRKDRREEIMAQLEADRKKEKKKRDDRFCRTVSVIYTILAAAFIALLLKLNALPEKYLYPAIGILAVASLFIVPVMFSRKGKKGRGRGKLVGKRTSRSRGSRQKERQQAKGRWVDSRFLEKLLRT